jgi:hypothetical protein
LETSANSLRAQLRILAMQRDRGFQRPEIAREVEVLVLRQMLIGKDQDGVSGKSPLDVRNIGRPQCCGSIDVAYFGSEARRCRTDGNGHNRRLPSNFIFSLAIESQARKACN